MTSSILLGAIFLTALASFAIGCDNTWPAPTISAVRQNLEAAGFRTYAAPSYVFSIPKCGRPISAVIAGGEQQHGLAFLFRCLNDSAARVARVPAGDEMPGTRVRRGRYFVIVNGDALLRRRLIASLTNGSR